MHVDCISGIICIILWEFIKQAKKVFSLGNIFYLLIGLKLSMSKKKLSASVIMDIFTLLRVDLGLHSTS